MAGDKGTEGTRSKQKQKKRKLDESSIEGALRPCKTRGVELPEGAKVLKRDSEVNKNHPWGNLQLILSLQSKELDIQQKLELALNFVKARGGGKCLVDGEDLEAVKLTRLIVFLNDWIQSSLISSGKRGKVGEKSGFYVDPECLDTRCWQILKFCLENSSALHIPLNLSRNLLQPICLVARHAFLRLNDASLVLKEFDLSTEEFEFYSVVSNCVSLLFSSHEGTLNENLELWLSTIDAVVQLVNKVLVEKLESGRSGTLVLQFSCLLLEPFAKFMRTHPTRKGGFAEFIDKLLEPLLELLGFMQLHISESNERWPSNLLKLVEEVLYHGLFHSTHIDGFLSLHSTVKYLVPQDGKGKASTTVIKSYHRHLFDKLERIVDGENFMALNGIGGLFHLLADGVKKQILKAMPPEGIKASTRTKSSTQPKEDARAGKSHHLVNLNAETRKSLFDFFVQMTEPLLMKLNFFLGQEIDAGQLEDIHCKLNCLRAVLSSFACEKVYIKTEDISGGACLGFLKKVYDTLISLSTKLNQNSSSRRGELVRPQMENLLAVAEKMIAAFGCLLEIQYEVIGDDIVILWSLMISFLALGISENESTDRGLLLRKIQELGCQLVNLYSELRQVNSIIFALCQALRLSRVSRNADKSITVCMPDGSISSCGGYVKSVGTLLCSQEFKQALAKAISSIPEGQASGCIRQLAQDVSESLMWLKIECSEVDGKGYDGLDNSDQLMLCIDLQYEVLGRGLSEIYSLVLNSLTITRSNSTLVGSSLKELMAVIRPCLNRLLHLPSESMNEFLSFLLGCHSHETVDTNSKMSTHWALVFLFSLYMSCRSLFRQVISLMPPDSARKVCASIGDLLTAYPGKDLVERTDWTEEGYFSWISNTSASLLDLIQSISDIYLQSDDVDCSCLIYQLHGMVVQRLVDLNRKIKSAEYVLQSADYMLQSALLGDGEHSIHRKKCRKWENCISKLKKEAEGLTGFILGYLNVLTDGPEFSTCSGVNFNWESPYEGEKWDFGFSSVNRRNVHTALWWVICRNIDVWCSHAHKKKLKKFLALLIHSSLPSTALRSADTSNCKNSGQPLVVTVQQISNELLRDSTLYEHKFVRRYLASEFCKMLEKSAVALFPNAASSDYDFSLSPNWDELLVELEESSEVSRGNRFGIRVDKPMCHSFDSSKNEPNGVIDVNSRNFAICQNLLRFLCWMPKGYLNSRSCKLYVTYVLNIERLAVSHMLNYQGNFTTCENDELFKLFLCCRKFIKYLVAASCNEDCGAGVLFEGSLPYLWLFKSVYLVLCHRDAQAGNRNQYMDTAFSLMDHTSYIFLVSSKYYSAQSHNVLVDAKGPDDGTGSDQSNAKSNLIESASYSDSSKAGEAWESMLIIGHIIKKETRALLGFLEDAPDNKSGEYGRQLYSNKMSCLVSCLSGYFWGVASALSQIDGKEGEKKVAMLRRKKEFVSELNMTIHEYMKVVQLQLLILLDCSDEPLDFSGNLSGIEEFSGFNGTSGMDICGQGRPLKGVVKASLESAGVGYDSSLPTANSHGSDSEVGGSIPTILVEVNSFDLHIPNKHLLQRILDGDERGAGFMLRHLLISYSALLRLNLQVGAGRSSPSFVHTLLAIACFLILELANSSAVPEPFIFIALDGCLKYFEELGNHLPLTDPSLSRNLYTKLIELHLMAIGKCISLQGKKYTLISHETESSTKILQTQRGSNGSSFSNSSFCLDEFKARLRMSFEVFIKKSSELHLLSGVQAIERALVGVQFGCTANYDISTGTAGGGEVSSYVAAGIDCLDMLLENVTGRKRLNVVRRHIQSLLSGLFNIILHVQSPIIFMERFIKNSGDNGPDPGAVILMCIEVLIRISGKHALFTMDSWHVAQSLRIPAALFKEFSQLRFCDPEASFDHQFSVDIYASCCRLMYTVLKHHKSESEKCIAQLQDSASVLLHTLETVKAYPISSNNGFSWNVPEGIKCACSLRRIYEEMRQQKDVFGPHCFKLLASYIQVYSGFGPLKSGIRREIDEALRPGIYALIDTCSADDLQYLHTVFGEGPCRSTLATLQHDYMLNFQYAGKV